MENPIYIGLSRQIALQRAMDVTANNLANMSTTAFKAERVLFSEYLAEPSFADREHAVLMVNDYASLYDSDQGAITPTGNSLDVAIDGPGYFAVTVGDDERYTRNGHFRLDADRQLVDANGSPVQAVGGGPIVIPEEDSEIEIASDGAVSSESGPIAQLRIVAFDDLQAMEPVGNGQYATEQDPLEDEDSTIIQGMIETSNVEPISEMVRMIEIQRSYQSTSRMLQQEHERLRDAANKIARIA